MIFKFHYISIYHNDILLLKEFYWACIAYLMLIIFCGYAIPLSECKLNASQLIKQISVLQDSNSLHRLFAFG